MEKKEFIHQVLDLHKAAFENYFSMMAMFQDQTEKLFKPFLDNVPGMNNEGKRFINEWTNEYKKNRDDFKKSLMMGMPELKNFSITTPCLSFRNKTRRYSMIF